MTTKSSFLSQYDLLYLLTVDVEPYCCASSCSVTHTGSVRILWKRDRPVAETSTCTNTQISQKTDTDAPPTGFEPTIPASGRPQRHALDTEDTVSSQIKSYATIIQTNSHFSVDKKNQLDVTFCILYFSSNSCSTCFGQPCTHHQELTTA